MSEVILWLKRTKI